MTRPKTGRTEKFTLYMSTEAMDNLTLLAGAYGITSTDLLNNLITKFCKEQCHALAMLKSQRHTFREMFCNMEANNDNKTL